MVRDAEVELPNPGTAIFSFGLPAGAYATAVLRELIQPLDGTDG